MIPDNPQFGLSDGSAISLSDEEAARLSEALWGPCSDDVACGTRRVRAEAAPRRPWPPERMNGATRAAG